MPIYVPRIGGGTLILTPAPSGVTLVVQAVFRSGASTSVFRDGKTPPLFRDGKATPGGR